MSVLENRRVSKRDAVMFDIDDTLIFANGRANKPVIKILRRAHDLGYKIIIITARFPYSKQIRQYTKQQLQDYQIPYHKLFIVPAENKGKVKKKTGLRYILSVGDKDTDLTNSKHTLKVE